MANYRCPNQHRERRVEFIICRAMMEPGKDYNNTDTAINAFCGHQYRCRITGQCENTPEAVNCPKNTR